MLANKARKATVQIQLVISNGAQRSEKSLQTKLQAAKKISRLRSK
jgi:hypothetical protein